MQIFSELVFHPKYGSIYVDAYLSLVKIQCVFLYMEINIALLLYVSKIFKSFVLSTFNSKQLCVFQ